MWRAKRGVGDPSPALEKVGMGKGQKKQKTSGKLGWRSKKANHGRKPGMGRGKRN